MYRLLLLPALLILLWLFCIRPYKNRRAKAEAFCKNAFAHRGLHGTVPENTLPAFAKARENSVGIELDVRLTKDKEVVVFHDETLLRAAGLDRKISDLTYAELKTIPLFGSEETVPLLSEAVREADGVPLLVEIKAYIDCAELCEKTCLILQGYKGPLAIESFSPIALRWFAKNRPEYLRGQLSSRFKDREAKAIPLWQRLLITNLLTNFLAKPDFLAYDIRNKHQISLQLCKKIYHVPVLYWTVQCGEKEGCIFENQIQRSL